MSVKNVSLIVLSATLLLGCKPKNPNLYGQYEAPKPLPESPMPEVKNTAGPKPTPQAAPEGKKVQIPAPIPTAPEPARYTQVDDEIYKPKVDILFFMDQSDSMKDDQANLQKNIRKFADNFSNKIQFLDLHIGVVTAWDSISYADLTNDCTLGQLRPLGGLKKRISDINKQKYKGRCELQENQVPYITNETDPSLWGPTLSFGVEAFKRETSGNVALNSGPQHEEIFSSVIAALSPSNQTMNKNFRRSEAHLAVVFFTDTDDFDYINIDKDALNQDATTKASLQKEAAKLSVKDRENLEVLPSEIAQFLKSQEKENATVSVYGALGRYNDWISTNGQTQGVYKNADFYIQQPGRGPRKIVEFLDLVNGKGFDLRDSNYGSKLAEIGNDIVKKSLRRVISLDYTPEIGNPKRPIIVKYGATQEIPKDDNAGWSYRVEKDQNGNNVHKIIISENSNLTPETGAKFSVEYTPVNAQTNVQ